MNFPSEIQDGIVSYVPKPLEVRAARELTGKTQAQCAQLVHTKTRSWQQWEYGEARMSASTWELFCIKTGAAYVPDPANTVGLKLTDNQPESAEQHE